MREGQSVTNIQKRAIREISRASRVNDFGQRISHVNVSKLASDLKVARSTVNYLLKTLDDAGLIVHTGSPKIYVGTEHGMLARDIFNPDEAIPVSTNRYTYKKVERDLVIASHRIKALAAQAATDLFMCEDFVPRWYLIDPIIHRADWLVKAASKKLKNIEKPLNRKALLFHCSQLAEYAGVMAAFMHLLRRKEYYNIGSYSAQLFDVNYRALFTKQGVNLLFGQLKKRGTLFDPTAYDDSDCPNYPGSIKRARVLLTYSTQFSCDLNNKQLLDFELRLSGIRKMSERLMSKIDSNIAREKRPTQGTMVPRTANEGLTLLIAHRAQVEFGQHQLMRLLYRPESKNHQVFFRGLKRLSKKTTISEEDLIAGLVALYRFEDNRARFKGLPPSTNWIGSPMCNSFLATVAQQMGGFDAVLADQSQDLQDYFEGWLDMSNQVFMGEFGHTLEGAYGASLVNLNKYRALRAMLTYRGQTSDIDRNLWSVRYMHDSGRQVTPRQFLFAQVRAMNEEWHTIKLPNTSLLIDALAPMRAIQYVNTLPSPSIASPEDRATAKRILIRRGIIEEVTN